MPSSVGKLARALAALTFMCALAAPAAATVRFGRGVRIGGHDFSHQTHNKRHRLVVRLYDRPVRGAGCVLRADGRGGQVKTCRLRRIRPQ